MTDRNITTGECPHGIDRISRYCEVCDAAMNCPDPEDQLKDAKAHAELLVQGMAEMAQRFTLRMDGAKTQIDELRECLILAVKELDAAPPTSIYAKGICARARKALNLWGAQRMVEIREAI